jgi:hypothetical protein
MIVNNPINIFSAGFCGGLLLAAIINGFMWK